MKILTIKERVRKLRKKEVKGIYLIACKKYNKKLTKDSKRYFGQSIDCERKMREHLLQLRQGIHRSKNMQDDFNTYGEASFEFRIYDTIKGTNKKLSITERFINNMNLLESYRQHYKTYDLKYGYNTKLGNFTNHKKSTSLDHPEPRIS